VLWLKQTFSKLLNMVLPTILRHAIAMLAVTAISSIWFWYSHKSQTVTYTIPSNNSNCAAFQYTQSNPNDPIIKKTCVPR
jgi:hypothetical protein